MSETQAGVLFAFMIMLVLYSYLVTVLTPFWLTEGDVMQMLASFERSMIAFFQMPVWARWAALAGILAAGGSLLLRRKKR